MKKDRKGNMGETTNRSFFKAYLAAFLGSALFIGTTFPAGAADWKIEGEIEEQLGFDDNVRFDAELNESSFFSILTPGFTLSKETERTNIEISPRLSLGLFTESSDLNYIDQYLQTNIRHRTQTGSIGFQSDISHVTTLESEVDDTGNTTDEDGKRLLLTFRPFWQQDITERDNIELRGRVQRAFYYSAPDLEDYSVYGGGATYLHQLTERDQLGAATNFGYFKNEDDSKNDSYAVDLLGAWRRKASERLSITLEAGPQFIHSEERQAGGGSESDDAIIPAGKVTLEWRPDERSEVAVEASHGIDPSGGGNAVVRDQIRLDIDHLAWPTVGFSLSSSYRRNNDATDVNDGDDREFFSVQPGVYWDMARNWRLAADYRIRWQDRTSERSTTSNAVFLSLVYSTPVWNLGD